MPGAAVTRFILSAALLLVAGCTREGEIDQSGGIFAVRSACPAVGVPIGTGDVTLFDPPAQRTAAAIDVTAAITNVRATCNDAGETIASTLSFDVVGQRRDTASAREVVLPYFVVVTRASTQVVAKQVGRVALRFEAGQARASAAAQATTSVQRSAATLPESVRERLTQKRKAGREEAAVDPLADPAVRETVQQASFEALVGFQLTDEQLKYNATR
jgi:hypothetical protein